MKLASILVLILFTIGFLISLAVIATNPRYIPDMELGVLWLRQAICTFIASVASLAILIRCLNGQGVADVTSLLVAILAALAIIAPEWQTTIPLGLVVIAFVVKEIIPTVHSRKTES